MGSLPRLLRLGYRAIFTVLAASPRSQALWSNVRRLAGVVGSVVLGGLGLDSADGGGATGSAAEARASTPAVRSRQACVMAHTAFRASVFALPASCEEDDDAGSDGG